MEKSKVILVPCEDYEEEKVYASIRDGLDALGGIGAFVKAEEKVLVKPNFLSPAEAEKAITTHPAVIRAVCRLLSENGNRQVTLGDSPAAGSCKTAISRLELKEEDLFGARVGDMSEEAEVPFPKGRACKRFHFCREVAEADAIIGLCKMKTHMLERITGAVKNAYGLICGPRKAAGHVSYPTAVKFAKMLADIHRATPQRLHIMDGIIAMEGNGPASGNPRKMGLLLISADPVALDTVFCRLIHLQPQLVPTNLQGELAGIGTFRESEIEIKLAEKGEVSDLSMEEAAARFGKADFDVRRDKEAFNVLTLWSKLSGGKRKPKIDPQKCVRCGICVEHCPVDGKALSFRNGRQEVPVYDYHKCIRCYCCQELCPQKAISVK